MRMMLLLALMARLCPFALADGTSAVLPELSTQAFVGTQLFGPQHDEEWVKQCLNLNLDKKFGCRIIAYRIRWFSGSWSSWFVPGVNDLYKKDGEPLRRFWACFNDHGFEILYMADAKINFSQASTAAPGNDVGIGNLAIAPRALETTLNGTVVCDAKGSQRHPAALRTRIKPDSTVLDVVRLLGPGYVSPESGTGTITWYFDDGSLVSTFGWPSSGAEKVAVMERPDELRKPAVASGGAPVSEALRLESSWGFRSLDFLFNRDRWAGVSESGENRLRGTLAVGLDHPRQVILLHNAWSIPMAGAQDDIRLTDLQQNVLRPSLDFVPDWPTYNLPGYIVAVHKRDGQWALIASLGQYFLIEEGGTVGLLRRDHP